MSTSASPEASLQSYHSGKERSLSVEPPQAASPKAASSSKLEDDKSRSRSRSNSPSPSPSPSPSSSAKPDDDKPDNDKSDNDAKEDDTQAVPTTTNAHTSGDWQAIWSPQHNTYYFHNLRTNETTWTNPLASADAATASTSAQRYDAQAVALAQGIDPALAYLDPSLAAGPSNPSAFTFTAKFNAHTGAFARPDARNPDHVSEYERMRRMSEFYFDVDAWQRDLEAQQEEEEAGKKRKKPTKKDLDMYKERKKQKKLAKTAWLRT